MSSISTMVNLIKNGDKRKINLAIGNKICRSKVSRMIPDKIYLKIMYHFMIGAKLNLKNPNTFNEKLQWLKINNRHLEYQKMVDKYKAKEYVASIIGEEYIIPTLGVWNSFDEIDFDKLPDQFVLKCTHDSGSVVICKDKSLFNKDTARKRINKGLKNDRFWHGREWPYKDVPRKIICEKYMSDGINQSLNDYKIMCFNGKAKLVQTHTGRFSKHHYQDFYDLEWNHLEIAQDGGEKSPIAINKPDNLDEMIRLSEILAKDIPHVRVDWYSIKGRLFFGELTFFDGSGFDKFSDYSFDELLGSWISLPEEKI